MNATARPTPPRSAPQSLASERLFLRRWLPEDRPCFTAMNADPAVMEFFPSMLTAAESDAFADRIDASFEDEGYGLWALETKDEPGFLGYVGFWPATFEASFTPAVEIGWRLCRESWGRGYASEAAAVVLDDGFRRVGLDEIVSFTPAQNTRSRRVMEKIGLTLNQEAKFDHPALVEGHPLRRHVLYRMRAIDFF